MMAKRLFLTDIDMNGNSISGLKNPVNPNDAATKQYVDGMAGGSNLKIASGKIENTAWTSNGDGSYSYTIDLSTFGIASISAVSGSEHIPQIILFKKDLSSSTTELVDAQFSFADISDGTTTTNSIKITINFSPAAGELFYFSIIGKSAA